MSDEIDPLSAALIEGIRRNPAALLATIDPAYNVRNASAYRLGAAVESAYRLDDHDHHRRWSAMSLFPREVKARKWRPASGRTRRPALYNG